MYSSLHHSFVASFIKYIMNILFQRTNAFLQKNVIMKLEKILFMFCIPGSIYRIH